MKKITAVLMVMVLTAALWGCAAPSGESEVTVLAAASLTDVCGELKTVYEEENEGITINFSFGGSGALQTQIEEGAPADMFISAADTQMNALLAQGLIEEDSVTELLENKAVLIVPEGNPADINSFEDVLKADLIGIGEVSSVPVGQYSMEIFENLGIWEQVREKANFGSDVRAVLSWVESGDVDCGVVYATDAYTGKGIETVCEAPDGSCSPVIYPAGITSGAKSYDAAHAFLDFLTGDEAEVIFEKYGFTVVD